MRDPSSRVLPLPPPSPQSAPNIVLITTDDQTVTDLAKMPITRRLLKEQGVTFSGISPHPLCCPARAEILTGQFAQNNGVLGNVGSQGGYQALDTCSTVATWLRDAGYQTAFMGKFLNGYQGASINDPAPGWDEWHPGVGIYNYNHFTVNHNGRPQTYDTYQTDYFAGLGARTIRTFAKDRRPFFLWQSFLAPHRSCRPVAPGEDCWSPPVPASRHASRFPTELPPAFDDPSYNEADVSDKPAWVRKHPLISSEARSELVRLYRMRLRALQAVDEGVRRLVRALADTGRLDNTLIIFTSDNGFLFGEHRLEGKDKLYEPALDVPFIMRGPGIPHGTTARNVAATVDIAPTIVAAARAAPTLSMDGRNLLPLVTGGTRGRDTLLIQSGAQFADPDALAWRWRGVRTHRYTFAIHTQTRERELYDRKHDPAQEYNVASDPRYEETRRELGRRLTVLKTCSGTACRQHFGMPPAPVPP